MDPEERSRRHFRHFLASCRAAINMRTRSLCWPRMFDGATIQVSSRCSDGGSRTSSTNVLVLCPGGLEHGGGIGRQMGYFLAALPRAAETPAYRVIDTRGPWFLGGARWLLPLSILYLVAAALRIAWAGITGRRSLLHVNITGRGSTARKLVLTAIARAVALPYVLHIHDYDYAVDVRVRGDWTRAWFGECSPLRHRSSS